MSEATETPLLVFDAHQQQQPVMQMRNQVQKHIYNIGQWTDAFLVFIAIYTERCPDDIADILKYMQLVRSMASNAKPNLFLTYDRDFRKLRAHNNMPGSILHHELFLSLHCKQVAFNVGVAQQKPIFPQQKQSFRAGLCFAFCATGRCNRPANCPFTHACPNCGGKHAKFRCPQSKAMLPTANRYQNW